MRNPLSRPALALLLSSLAGCSLIGPSSPRSLAVERARNAWAPQAAVRPEVLGGPEGRTRVDEYYWLNQREDPEVIAYLEAENAYTAEVLGANQELERTLLEEMKGRIAQDDASVPSLDRDFYYYQRYEEGREYPLSCRVPAQGDGAPAEPPSLVRGPLPREEVLLDQDSLAKGQSYFAVMGMEVSENQFLLAYAVDTVGRRIATIRFRDLRTRRAIPDRIENVTGNLAWAADDRTLFYVRQDPVTLRSYQVWKHVLGEDPAKDALVFQEDDEEYSVSLGRTKSRAFLTIHSSQTLADEVRVLPADQPDGEFQVLVPRQRGHEYRVEHHGEHFYFVSNDQARNFRLMRAPVATPGREHWEVVVPHRADTLLERIEVFDEHLVLFERHGGLPRIRVQRWDGSGERTLAFRDPAYALRLGPNEDPSARFLRFTYTSLTTPNTVFDEDLVSGERVQRKQDPVLGGFDPANYRSERLTAIARDGTPVPISLVYRPDRWHGREAPLLLYGYGSYGASTDASFRSDRLSLLDRGFGYAIAHVRGGSEMGRDWYEQGKMFHKENTFTDFLDCADFLAREHFCDPARMFAMGGSAGGLLMGAVVNLRPDRFLGVVAAVPFVDVVTTMLDDSIPLTTSEYDEWGNPNLPECYDCMLAYSPYDNVSAKDYPHLLVTTGLHDSQVQYFEPAKWVARLRARKTGDHLLLLHTNMEAGHGGASGRFRRLEETAKEYAFFLDLAGWQTRPEA